MTIAYSSSLPLLPTKVDTSPQTIIKERTQQLLRDFHHQGRTQTPESQGKIVEQARQLIDKAALNYGPSALKTYISGMKKIGIPVDWTSVFREALPHKKKLGLMELLLDLECVRLVDLDKGGNSLLHDAIRHGNTDISLAIIRELTSDSVLRAPSYLFHANSKKRTPLHYAAAKGNVEVIKSLLRHKKHDPYFRTMDNDFPDCEGNTPLHIACIYGNAPVIPLLLESDSFQWAENREGKTPLDIAKERKDQACIDALGGQPGKQPFDALEPDLEL